MTSARRAVVPALLLVAVILAAITAAVAALLVAWSQLGSEEPGAAAPVATATAAAADAEGWAAWDHNEDGGPVRWDPCSPLDLVLDPQGAYPGFRADLEDALAELRELTGLQLRLVDEVEERPDARRASYQPDRYGERWSPVLVAFAPPGEHDLPLLDVDHGIAAPVAVGPPGDRVYVTGQVVLNGERDLPGDERGWEAVLRHELGHLLGLDHVDDEQQLMYPHPADRDASWGDGDRRGLRALGEGGCVDVPEAQPIEVELDRAR